MENTGKNHPSPFWGAKILICTVLILAKACRYYETAWNSEGDQGRSRLQLMRGRSTSDKGHATTRFWGAEAWKGGLVKEWNGGRCSSRRGLWDDGTGTMFPKLRPPARLPDWRSAGLGWIHLVRYVARHPRNTVLKFEPLPPSNWEEWYVSAIISPSNSWFFSSTLTPFSIFILFNWRT